MFRSKLSLTITTALLALLAAPLGYAQNVKPSGTQTPKVQTPKASTAQSTKPNGVQPTKATPASAVLPNAKSQDNLVATVNAQPITRQDLGRECVMRYGDQVLENMLNKHLILQACKAQNIQITKEQVDNEIDRIAKRIGKGLTSEAYLKIIKDERGIDAGQYASDIVWPMLALRELARDKIQVSQQEIDKVFDSEYGPKVQVRMIAVANAQKANQLHQQAIADPSSFGRLAKEHSEDTESASVEGLLPPVRRNSGDDLLERVAFGLQPNQVSQIFNVGNLHVMLQCVRYIGSQPPAPAMVPTIQGSIRDRLSDTKLREMAETIFTSLRENSSVVKILGDVNLEKQNPGIAALINRQPITIADLSEECLQRFGPQVLEGEINRKILEGALASAKIQITQPDIDAEVARAADYYGFVKADGSPNVQEWMKNILEEDGATFELYVRDVLWPTVALKKLVAGQVEVTNEDIQKGFESNYGPRAEILAIVLSDSRLANKVWQMARDQPTDQFFGELANQYSVEPTSKSNFGKVTPLRRYGGQPTLEAEAFKLPPGGLSPVIELSGQYVILRSQGLTKPVVQDIAAVKDEIFKDILEKKTRVAMQHKLDVLLENTQIDNFLEKKSQLGKSATEASRKVLQEQTTSKR